MEQQKGFIGNYTFGELTRTDGSKYFAMQIWLHKKPSFVKRFCMKHLLGFNWKDNETI